MSYLENNQMNMRRQPAPGGEFELHGAPAKSPSPLSPTPLLANFRQQTGGSHGGPTPSLSPQQHYSISPYGAQARSPTMAESMHQRSPTNTLQWESHRRISAAQNPAPQDRRSPITAQYYMPPPPMRRPGRRNPFDDDANVEGGGGGGPLAGSLLPANPNSTVSGSVSPLSEGRFGYLALGNRPASAAAQWRAPPPSRGSASTAATTGVPDPRRAIPRAASSVSLARPSGPKTVFHNNCAAVVDEFDPRTGAHVASYSCGRHLGSGGFAEVYVFIAASTRQRFACKIIDKAKLGSSGEGKVQLEVEMHRRMSHPNIVRLYRMFSDEHYFFILLELCSTRNLMDICNENEALSVPEVQRIMRQLMSAVQCMHSKSVIHRDLKLGNIMVDEAGKMKIGDFGFANVITGPTERKYRLCGTPNYIAPEVLACCETKVGYRFEADIWSMGVLLFILAYGFPPFESKDVPSTYERIRRIDYSFPGDRAADSVPKCCRDLIASMLQRDPGRRPTPTEVLASDFLRHGPDATYSRERVFLLTATGQAERSPPGASPVLPASTYSGTMPGTRYALGDTARREDGRGGVSPIMECDPSDLHSPTSGRGGILVRKTLNEFLHEQDPSSTTGTASDHTDTDRPDTDRLRGGGYGNGNGECRAVATGPRYREAGRRVVAPERPAPPAVFFKTVVFASKYGHGFALGSPHDGGRIAMMFNDRTKMVYDQPNDLVHYYARSPGVPAVLPGTGAEDGGRGSAVGSSSSRAPSGTRNYIDSRHDFAEASVSLRVDSSSGGGVSGGPATYHSPAQKKFAIVKFLQPFLRGGGADSPSPTLHSSLGYLADEKCGRGLFSPPAADNCADPIYTKDALMQYLVDLDPKYAGVNMLLTAVRFSNASYQISVMCTSSCPVHLTPTTESPVVPPQARWRFDILIYGPFHAVFGIETHHSRIHQSFRDIRTDLSTTSEGRIFLSAASTQRNAQQFMLPTELLRILGLLLHAARFPPEIMNCFSR